MATDLEKALLQELADIRAGRAVHTHTCTDGHPWRCTSPYCFDLHAPCSDHGGGPIGRPPAYAFDHSYNRLYA